MPGCFPARRGAGVPAGWGRAGRHHAGHWPSDGRCPPAHRAGWPGRDGRHFRRSPAKNAYRQGHPAGNGICHPAPEGGHWLWPQRTGPRLAPGPEHAGGGRRSLRSLLLPADRKQSRTAALHAAHRSSGWAEEPPDGHVPPSPPQRTAGAGTGPAGPHRSRCPAPPPFGGPLPAGRRGFAPRRPPAAGHPRRSGSCPPAGAGPGERERGRW